MNSSLSHLRPGDDAGIYLFPYTLPDGIAGHLFISCPRHKEQELRHAIKEGRIPKFGQVIACGKGQPDERMRLNIERYYGHIQEQPEAA